MTPDIDQSELSASPSRGKERPPTMLFTAFEPSGDEHAAAVIADLKRRVPDLVVWGTGGQHMEAAGATLIERTVDDAAMLGATLTQIRDHLARLKRLKAWLQEHPIDVHVPVDSPAANWSICKLVRKTLPKGKVGVVHMVCPQVWAWASWRVRRLQRLSDHVICLLPFEPAWLAKHDVRGTFVGHPVLSEDIPGSQPLTRPLPDAPKKLALLPGSRRKEVERNWPLMLDVFKALRKEHPDLHATFAALDQRLAGMAKGMTDEAGLSEADRAALHTRIDETGPVLDWADNVLVTSGTATLHVAIRHKPMVAVYSASWWFCELVGRVLVSTETFTLPNLISEWDSGERAIVEFAPHFGEREPIIAALRELFEDDAARQKRVAALQRVTSLLGGHDWGKESADILIQRLSALRSGEG